MSPGAERTGSVFGSVRGRVTVVVAALSALAFGAVAAVAPDAVADVLEDDLLTSEAEQAFAFTQIFTLEAGEFVVDTNGQPLELEDGVLFAVDVPAFPIDAIPIEAFPDGDPVEIEVGDVGGDLVVDEVDADGTLLASAIEDDVADGVELLRSVGVFDDLVETSGGSFAIDLDSLSFAVVEANGSFDLVFGDVASAGLPILTQLELDDLLFDDLGIFENPAGSVVDVDTGGRLLLGLRDVDDLTLLVAADASTVDRSVDRVRIGLWLAVPLLTVIIAALAWLVTSRALRPVRSITEQAATISGGSLDARVPVPGADDEIGALAVTVNEMLDRLEDDATVRRRFVSDASHELRTPVAVMRNEAEVSLQYPGTADAGELATTVATETQRLSAIIDDLLALARRDEGAPTTETQIDLDDIVMSEARRTRRLTVDASGVSAGRVRGRHDELSRMVGHLLDNATRHAAERVMVSLRDDGHVVLTVDDDGPGVPPDERERIFDRFARLDDARTRDSGGAGLGLAVVTSIAERSGATVMVTDSPLGGARFVVTFA
ncbi:MAG: ATP-binding protein [Ilumatobacter sp.]